MTVSAHQVKTAEDKVGASDGAVTPRIPEAYQWILVPSQDKPDGPVVFTACRMTGQEALAVRASAKLRNDGRLLCAFGGSVLRKSLDAVPLWRGNHVEIKQLMEDFARYLYLERLKSPHLVLNSVRAGLAQFARFHGVD